MKSKKKIAAKLENIDSQNILLVYEAIVLKKLQVLGFPEFISYGHYNKYNILIMELLG